MRVGNEPEGRAMHPCTGLRGKARFWVVPTGRSTVTGGQAAHGISSGDLTIPPEKSILHASAAHHRGGDAAAALPRRFPRGGGRAVRPRRPDGPPPRGSGATRLRILIAEDDPVSRRLLEATLARWDYEVAVACDGTSALEMPERE